MYDKYDFCRICLERGAKLPLFEPTESQDGDILGRLNLCLNEKVEDVKGYPKFICQDCSDTLDNICNFITRYKETCIILASNLPTVKEERHVDQGLLEVPIEIENIKKEVDITNNITNDADDSIPLTQLKLKKDIKNETSPKGKDPETLKIKAERRKNDINKIASSILEGDFAWIGDVWCIKSSKPGEIKGKKIKKLKLPRQKELKIIVPKIPKVAQTPPTRLCDLCGEIFKDQDKLNLHKRKAHFTQPMQCPYCPQQLVSQYYLNRHLKRRHDAQGKSFSCPQCGRAFAFKGEMTTHIKNVHNKHLKPKKTYKCSICNKTYKCAKSVLVHERSQHTGQRPAECQICGTGFYHEDYLREHMRLHTGETPFKCPVCDRGYAQRCNMKSHLRIHRISELDINTLNKIRPSYIKLLRV